MSNAKVQTDLTAEDAKLQAALKRGQSGIKQFATQAGEQLKRLGKAFMVVGAAAAGAAGLFVKMATVQADAEAKLEAVLKATGHAAGYSADELKKMASELQNLTKYGDETTLSAQAILLTFKGIKGDEFRRTTELAMDLSTVLGIDLKGSVMQLGKALNDPLKGLSMLTRVGITFTDQQKDQVKAMQKVGDVAGAQRVMLAELASQFGGAASAAAKTFSGRLAQMKNRLGDVGEQIGMALILVLEKLEPLLKSIAKWLERVDKRFIAAALGVAVFVGGAALMVVIAAKVITAIKGIIAVIHMLIKAQIIQKAFSGPAGWAMIATGAAVAAAGIYGLSKAFTTMNEEAKDAIDEAKKVSDIKAPGASASTGLGAAAPADAKGKTKEKTSVELKAQLETLEEMAAVESRHLAIMERKGLEYQKHIQFAQEEIAAAGNTQTRETAWAAAKEAYAVAHRNEKAIADSKERQASIADKILAAQIAYNNKADVRKKTAEAMLEAVNRELETIGKTEDQVAAITIARLVAEGKIDAALGRQLLTRTKELRLAKEAVVTAEKMRAETEAEKTVKAAAKKSATENLEQRIKDLEKQGEQAYMSTTTRIIDDLQRAGASLEQIQRAQKALAVSDTKTAEEKAAAAAAKAAKSRDKTGGDRGFKPAFEGLTALYKRVATGAASKPADRTATATEQMAKHIKEMNDRMKNQKQGAAPVAVMGT